MLFTAGLNLQAFNPGLFAENWTAVALSALVAAVAIIGMFTASQKLTTYECGIPVTNYAWSNINVRFYIFAILFLIFDVEAVFLFPWAVIFMEQKVVHGNVIPFYAMIMFLGILFFAIVYAWRKGVLEWRK